MVNLTAKPVGKQENALNKTYTFSLYFLYFIIKHYKYF